MSEGSNPSQGKIFSKQQDLTQRLGWIRRQLRQGLWQRISFWAGIRIRLLLPDSQHYFLLLNHFAEVDAKDVFFVATVNAISAATCWNKNVTKFLSILLQFFSLSLCFACFANCHPTARLLFYFCRKFICCKKQKLRFRWKFVDSRNFEKSIYKWFFCCIPNRRLGSVEWKKWVISIFKILQRYQGQLIFLLQRINSIRSHETGIPTKFHSMK